ncbi:MAG: two pore domain potassium channel family protein [Alphaproteobacteria bacterium]|nr:two pore domain potassium channel family protein [Alphaproteobacteria bacterium]
MISSRHWFVTDSLDNSASFDAFFQKAIDFEIAGNWYLAGESYSTMFDSLDRVAERTAESKITKAKVLTRAASCFELAQDSRTSARFYERAAQEVATSCSNPQLAAELFNRAALQFSTSSEYFFAGSAWVRAAEEFNNVQLDVINCSENLAPLPISSFKSHLCGLCLEAAAMAFENSPGNEMWSVGAYWRAGMAYSKGIPNIQAFNAFRRALNANVRHYDTLEAEQLMLSLPLSPEERASKIDPILVLEAALSRCNNHHQQQPGNTFQSRIQTNRQMAEVFHGFNLELQAVGNAREASMFRSRQNELQREIFISRGELGAAVQYWLWKITSNYGESLSRWAVTCVLVILAFAVAYAGFGAITSGSTSIDKSLRIYDYIYFSIITFSTLGYGDLHPIGLLGQILACLEVFCGLIMFGLLLSFVGSRFQRR